MQGSKTGYVIVTVVLSLALFSFISFLKIEAVDIGLANCLLPALAIVVAFRTEWLRVPIVTAFRGNRGFAHVCGIALLLLVPFALRGNAYLIHICVMIGLYTIMAVGLNVYLGSIGMVNFCFGAYFGIGAYTSALLSTMFGISFWAGLVMAGIGGLVAGVVVSVATLKNKGFYYVLITFAFQQVFHLMVNNMEWTGGPDGVVKIPFPTIGGYSLGQPLKILGATLPFQANFYYLILGLIIVTFIAVMRIDMSRTGLLWNAIRDDEISASCYGINILRGKIEAGGVGGFFGGIAGPLYAHYVGYISPEVFTWEVSAGLLSMLILGGINNVYGVAAGVTILTVFTEKFQLFANYRTLLFGIIILACLMFKPGGFIPEQVRRYDAPRGTEKAQ